MFIEVNMRCEICKREDRGISKILKVCARCIKEKFEEAKPYILEVHKKSREAFGLKPFVPEDREGIRCIICANRCKIGKNDLGYCGLRKNVEGKLLGPRIKEAKVSWYLDPLPTNCVADWVCPAGTGCGYPEFAYKPGPEYGYYNLAVFFHACSLNCLFCQNWHFRKLTFEKRTRTIDEFLRSLSPAVACICYFGGDPSPQAPFAIKASEEAIKNKKNRILRICWETNGLFNKNLLKSVVRLSLLSGGCVKFDLKAHDERLHIALTGVSNRKILENFAFVATFIKERSEVPLLVASTLLVPGYVDENEVYEIAKFIANINPSIPYRLLAFYPHFYMEDLPLISKTLAYNCLDAAKKAGLKRVSIGNIHLLR